MPRTGNTTQRGYGHQHRRSDALNYPADAREIGTRQAPDSVIASRGPRHVQGWWAMGRARDRGRPRGNDPALKTYARRQLVARIRAERRPYCQHPHCQLPGVPIDYNAPRGHPLALQVDEILPRAHGGNPEDYQNVRATHTRCNTAAGARLLNDIHSTTRPAPKVSRTW